MESSLISEITSTLIWLGFFVAIFLAYYYYLMFRNKERMILLERNTDLMEVYKKKNVKMPWHIIGFTSAGIGIGLFFSLPFVINVNYYAGGVSSVALALLFGGMGVLIGFKKQKKERLNG
ncbi:MAG: hypothetical protein COC06_10415 [Bacteroidales bacterium]|nr:MAG: hypothetical protein COC06_10415 [Bacteroidales bacterium]